MARKTKVRRSKKKKKVLSRKKVTHRKKSASKKLPAAKKRPTARGTLVETSEVDLVSVDPTGEVPERLDEEVPDLFTDIGGSE
jgi:hypothetical protein